MKLSRVFGAVALAGVLAAQGAAQDAVAIRFPDFKAGDRVKVTEDETGTATTSAVENGVPKKKVDKAARSVVYVEECVTAGEAGKRPLKATRVYEKVSGAKDGQPLDPAAVGKTIAIEKKGERYEFTIDGTPLTGGLALELAHAYSRPDTAGVKGLFPSAPLKPGESWKVDAKKVVPAFSDGKFTFDPDRTSMTGKLVKAYQKGGAGYGVFEVRASLPITALGPKSPLAVKPGSSVTATVIGDGCIDGSSAASVMVTKSSLRIEGSFAGNDLTVAADVEQKRTTEPLPKK